MSLSDFNGQIRYLGPNCLTVVLSYLQLREIHKLSRRLLEVHSIGNSICNPENCTQLQGLINGYYQMANSPRVHFLDFNYIHQKKTNSKDVFVHSPVLISQWKRLCSIEFHAWYDISDLLPASLVSVSTRSDVEDNSHAFQLNIAKRCPNLESFRAINYVKDEVLVALVNQCLNYVT